MNQYMSKEEYERKLSELYKEFSEIDEELTQDGIELNQIKSNVENIETAQGIINTLSETADIVNSTVNPLEFFDGYEKMYYLVDKLETVPDIKYSQQPPNEIRQELRGQRKPAIQKMIGRYYNYAQSMQYPPDAIYNTLSRYFSYMDRDHIEYINQLCKNGGKKKQDNSKKIRKFKNFYMHFSYFVDKVLFPPAKVMFVFWSFFWISTILKDGDASFEQKVIIVLFGYLIMCGVADLLYYKNKRKYYKYMIKVSEKKKQRLIKLMKDIDPVRYDNDYGNKNTAKNNSVYRNFDNMNGHEFEYFCADLLRQNGFSNVEVTKASGDHGIDVLAEKDGITYAVQCKCYSDSIGNSAVQQAHTGKSLYHKDIAVVMTNRYFTPQAMEEAMALGVKTWDRDKLIELIESTND